MSDHTGAQSASAVNGREVLEATRELDLSCAVCHQDIGVLERVTSWASGEAVKVAHQACTEAAR